MNSGINLRPYQQVLITAFPFILLMLSQSLNSIIDMFIVGRIGMNAIAAVGLCGFIFSIMTSCVTGIMISVQTVVAKSIGAGKINQGINALHSAIFVAIVLGISIVGLGFFVPKFITLFIHDEVLASNCITYLQALVLGAPAIGIVRAFRGYYGGIGENKISVLIIFSTYFFNFLIGFTLVSLGYGIRGAGLGTCCAFYIGACLFCLSGYFIDYKYRFFKVTKIFEQIGVISKLSFYAGIQQLFFSAGFAVMFIIASQMNSPALAVITVLNNLMLLSTTPLIGMGMASAVYVSRSLGENKYRDAKSWGNIAVKLGFGIFIIQLFILINPHYIMGLFIKDNFIVNNYIGLFKITVLFVFSEVFAQILKFSMFGAGFNRQLTMITVPLQWFLFIPLAIYLCLFKNHGIEILWFSFLVYRLIESIFMLIIWLKESWVPAKLDNIFPKSANC
ncbi:MATE family efflux transporter [Photorhabdus luminescens]|uniref:Multidrug-efflux transporter n=1 Tax=Photorhabdus luminescens subsp. sonorensis TaxID=1173677 RepID=A0A5C4RH03_PHOLU|nr:MATE family efflux transporter [Photorhabdus luminescens]TNH43034.1 MATE family efflux transporter [Photorhabdus luminescens subsp. sonorensis]